MRYRHLAIRLWTDYWLEVRTKITCDQSSNKSVVVVVCSATWHLI